MQVNTRPGCLTGVATREKLCSAFAKEYIRVESKDMVLNFCNRLLLCFLYVEMFTLPCVALVSRINDQKMMVEWSSLYKLNVTLYLVKFKYTF